MRLLPAAALLTALRVLGFPAAVSKAEPETAVTAADDAYHLSTWADGSHDASFVEWWYFNLSDPGADTRAILSYFVADPMGRLGSPLIQMVAVVYNGDGIVTSVDDYPDGAFSASEARADVAIGDCAIEVLDDDRYRVSGASLDGRLSWDLTYVREAPSWFAADRAAVGSLPWEAMSWLVYMPRAQVTGTLGVEGRTLPIHGDGYHDHNWGEWIPTDVLWNWAQHSSARLAFELGDFIGGPAGVASVELDGERVVFTKDRYRLRHTRWAFDAANRVFYPSVSLLTAEDDRWRLSLVIEAVETEALRGDLPLLVRDVVIYEQTARYTGRLWRKSPQGRWTSAALIRGDGFKEYTATAR